MTLRREFLGFTAGAVAARTVLPIAARAELFATVARTPMQPDAELLRLGRRFDLARTVEQAAWDVVTAAADIDTDDDPRWIKANALADATGKIVDHIEHIPARSLQGLLIKARAISWCHSGETIGVHIFSNPFVKHHPTVDEKLIVSLLSDLHAMTVTA